MEFIKRNKRYIDIVNPMQVFCDLPPGTYAHAHPEELGIDMKYGHRYWEAKDGTNTYLVRMRRFEEFCRLASALKIRCLYPSPVLLNRNELLGKYYSHRGETKIATAYFLRAIKTEARDIPDMQRLASFFKNAELRQLHEKCQLKIAELKTKTVNGKHSSAGMLAGLNALVKEQLDRETAQSRANNGIAGEHVAQALRNSPAILSQEIRSPRISGKKLLKPY